MLVPFPHAVDDHQTANARFLSDVGGAWLVPQAEFSAEWLADLFRRVTRDELTAMASRARGRAKTDAAERVASACLEVAR